MTSPPAPAALRARIEAYFEKPNLWHANKMEANALLRECLAALPPAETPAPQPQGEWQPIETAPKDGTEILVGWMTTPVRVLIASWTNGPYHLSTCWRDREGGYALTDPALWMLIPPLPAAPPLAGRSDEPTKEDASAYVPLSGQFLADRLRKTFETTDAQAVLVSRSDVEGRQD